MPPSDPAVLFHGPHPVSELAVHEVPVVQARMIPSQDPGASVSGSDVSVVTPLNCAGPVKKYW